jgi:hypothetical protein
MDRHRTVGMKVECMIQNSGPRSYLANVLLYANSNVDAVRNPIAFGVVNRPK